MVPLVAFCAYSATARRRAVPLDGKHSYGAAKSISNASKHNANDETNTRQEEGRRIIRVLVGGSGAILLYGGGSRSLNRRSDG